MRAQYIEIDLSSLLPSMGTIVRGINFELAVIRFYRMKVTRHHNALQLVNNYIANGLNYTKDVPYGYHDVTVLVKERSYNNALFKFYGKLEQLILKQVSPYVTDIAYYKVIDKDRMIIMFELYYD